MLTGCGRKACVSLITRFQVQKFPPCSAAAAAASRHLELFSWLVDHKKTFLEKPSHRSFWRQAAGGSTANHRHFTSNNRESPADRVKQEASREQNKALYEPYPPLEEASARLGAFLDIKDLMPGEVVTLEEDRILALLEAAPKDTELELALFAHANSVTERFFGGDVSYRGIIEFSNVCQKDCGYCGIRKHQQGVMRYTIPREEVVEAAIWAWRHCYGSVMLQSGELDTTTRMRYLTDVISEIREKTIELDLGSAASSDSSAVTDAASAHIASLAARDPSTSPPSSGHPEEDSLQTGGSGERGGGEEGRRRRVEELKRLQRGLCVALSVGELSTDKYKQLYEAGASRYLLRIETSNPALYAELHPPTQTFERRLECLRELKKVGFQVGTGVMIGLPGQTLRDLARDLVFFREERADMIGMGPYITEEGTPVADAWRVAMGGIEGAEKQTHMRSMFDLTTRMLAIARLTTGNTNIAATTALQAVNPVGREIGLRRGANILMPILTPTKYRVNYQLYEGKPCITDTADECRQCLAVRVGMIGKRVREGRWDDPPHFLHPVITPHGGPGVRAAHGAATSAALGASVSGTGAAPRGGAAGPVPRALRGASEGGASGSGSGSGALGAASRGGGRQSGAAVTSAGGPRLGFEGMWVAFGKWGSANARLPSGARVDSWNRGVPSAAGPDRAGRELGLGRFGTGSQGLDEGIGRAQARWEFSGFPGWGGEPGSGLSEDSVAGRGLGSSGKVGGRFGKVGGWLGEVGGGLGEVGCVVREFAGEAASDLPRVNVGVFGAMNVGKSTLLNLLTMQETSIVDATPGTTADTKIALMELHGVGPVKLFDTAGVDEGGALGEKKRRKAMAVLKECDIALVVVDPGRFLSRRQADRSIPFGPNDLRWESELLSLAQARHRRAALIFNLHEPLDSSRQVAAAIRRHLDPDGALPFAEIDLQGGAGIREQVTQFLELAIQEARRSTELPKPVPDQYLTRDAIIFLNIPMDAETPGARLLRPQALVQEQALRHFATTLAFRMDLAAARAPEGSPEREGERQRFMGSLGPVLKHKGPKLLITDSQAMDVVHPWTVDVGTGEPLIDITTFSIAMVQRQSGGRLRDMVEGIRAFRSLRAGDRVLVAEACNHNRITALCNDIATVQIPEKVAAQAGGAGVILDHAFGREFPDEAALQSYALAIHCGGCMIDSQKINARLEDLKEAGVPITNFGILLSYTTSPEALWRVVKPWGVDAQS